MIYFYSILAGLIQGITEFLPVSSSGHLIFLHELLNFNFMDDIAFDSILHLGTLLALVIFFRSDIRKYLKAFFFSLLSWNLRNDVNQRLAWYIFAATLPAAFAGYFFEDYIENIFRHPAIVSVALIGFGVVMYLVDQHSSRLKNINQLNFKNAFFIGLMQVAALIPGISRSGITIVAGLTQKLNRESAARFSFLLSIPIVFGAGLKKILDLSAHQTFRLDDIQMLILGFIFSFAAGYGAIKYFLKFLQNHSLKIFVVYRISLGLFILIWIYLSNNA